MPAGDIVADRQAGLEDSRVQMANSGLSAFLDKAMQLNILLRSGNCNVESTLEDAMRLFQTFNVENVIIQEKKWPKQMHRNGNVRLGPTLDWIRFVDVWFALLTNANHMATKNYDKPNYVEKSDTVLLEVCTLFSEIGCGLFTLSSSWNLVSILEKCSLENESLYELYLQNVTYFVQKWICTGFFRKSIKFIIRNSTNNEFIINNINSSWRTVFINMPQNTITSALVVTLATIDDFISLKNGVVEKLDMPFLTSKDTNSFSMFISRFFGIYLSLSNNGEQNDRHSDFWKSLIYRDILMSRKCSITSSKILLKLLNDTYIKDLSLSYNIKDIAEKWADRNFLHHNSDSNICYITVLLYTSISFLLNDINTDCNTLQSELMHIIIPGVTNYFHHPDERIRKYGMIIANQFSDLISKNKDNDGSFSLDFGKEFESDSIKKEIEMLSSLALETLFTEDDISVESNFVEFDLGKMMFDNLNLDMSSYAAIKPYIEEETSLSVIRRKRFIQLQKNVMCNKSKGIPLDSDDDDSSDDSEDDDNDLLPMDPTFASKNHKVKNIRTADSAADGVSSESISKPVYLRDCIKYFKTDDPEKIELALENSIKIIRHTKEDIDYFIRQFLHLIGQLNDNFELDNFDKKRLEIMEELVVCRPRRGGIIICDMIFMKNVGLSHRLDLFVVITRAFIRLGGLEENVDPIGMKKRLEKEVLLTDKFSRLSISNTSVVPYSQDENKADMAKKVEILVANKRGRMLENFGSVVLCIVNSLIDRLETDVNTQRIFSSSISDGATLLAKLSATLSILAVSAQFEVQILSISEKILGFLTNIIAVIHDSDKLRSPADNDNNSDLYSLASSNSLREAIKSSLMTILSIPTVSKQYGHIVNQFKLTANASNTHLIEQI